MAFKEFETEEDFNKFVEETKGDQPFKSFNESEWSDFEESLDQEKKSKYDEGQNAGYRMLFRDLKVEEGLDFEGKDFKHLDTLKTKLRDKLSGELGENVNGKVTELESDISVLRSQLEEKESLVIEANSKLESFRTDTMINSSLPEIQGIKRDHFVIAAKNAMRFGVDEEGKEVVYKGDDILKGKTRKPLSYKEALESYASQEGYLANDSKGRGDQSKKPVKNSKFKSIDELNAYAESEGISTKGQAYQGLLAEASKDKAFSWQ